MYVTASQVCLLRVRNEEMVRVMSGRLLRLPLLELTCSTEVRGPSFTFPTLTTPPLPSGPVVRNAPASLPPPNVRNDGNRPDPVPVPINSDDG